MKEKLAIGGSIISAITASLCCIGPLVFVALGMGGFAASALFERLRPYFLGLTLGLLGLAFYVSYRKPKAACADGAVCATGSSKAARWNKIMLWSLTFLVIVFAAFPYYAGVLSSALARSPGHKTIASASKAEAPRKLSTVVIQVQGMTCGACAGIVKASLEKVSGVQSAAVSFEKAEAQVEYNSSQVAMEKLVEAINQTGYQASLPK